MKVTLMIGNAAYAVIKDPAFSMDVLLSPGRSAHRSLRESAAVIRAQCADSLLRADRLERAAQILEKKIFDCPLCGQHITDGKPCGCGARA